MMVVELWKILLVLRGVGGKILSDIAYDGEIGSVEVTEDEPSAREVGYETQSRDMIWKNKACYEKNR